MTRKTLFAIVLVAVAVASATGCQKIKTRLGIADTITNPEPGTPEKTVQDVLRVAKIADEEEAWQKFVPLLHSAETESPASLSNWREFKFRSIRKKADYLLTDKNTYEYKVIDRRDDIDGKTMRIFVVNAQSDMPTPCKLERDPKQGNYWKLSGACF
jgi:hypothetical protein